MGRFVFDAAAPDLDGVRQVILARLRADPDWKQWGGDPLHGFDAYLELTPRPDDRAVFEKAVREVLWQLVIEEIIAPGYSGNHNFPWFQVTAHGRRVLADREYVPHDRRGYLLLLHERVQQPDATVVAYLDESLQTFSSNNLVASTVMLGVAAERVFDLVCESVLAALADTKEAKKFAEILKGNPMRPKLMWLHDKLQRAQAIRPRIEGIPESITLTVTAIYDLLRTQRNDLGHPTDAPPRPSRSQAYANLLVFAPYYESAEAFRKTLAGTKI